MECFELKDEGIITTEELNLEEKTKLGNLLKKYGNLQYREGNILTNTESIMHQIDLVPGNTGFHCRLYRLPQKHEEEVIRQVSELEAQGIIRKSKSRYASPVVIVAKSRIPMVKLNTECVLIIENLTRSLSMISFHCPTLREFSQN